LPFASTWEPVRLAALAAVSSAVWPVTGLSRYLAVTLSLWSWSTIMKLRTVGQALPDPSAPAVGTTVAEVPAAGTASRLKSISRFATRKKLAPLQNDTWPKIDPGRPLTQ